MYSNRTWLNPIESDSTGSIVCYSGKVTYKRKPVSSTFIEISDCQNKVRLHLSSDDTVEDFIRKLSVLKKEIGKFIEYLDQ